MVIPSPLSRALVWLLAGYQRVISPLLGPRCRFYPTCSSYAIESIQRLGWWRAVPYVAGRLARCHPWHRGGVDLPPGAHDGHVDGSMEADLYGRPSAQARSGHLSIRGNLNDVGA